MKHVKSFYAIALLSLIALTLLTTGCGKKETPVDKATREKILLVGNGAEPVNLDPALTVASNDYQIIRAIFEGLLILDPKTLEPRPAIATHWETSTDGLTYTFHLRNNARFSNGVPITAHNFVFAFKRLLSPNLGSIHAEYLFEIVNSKKYHTGTLTDFKEVGIKAIDDYTLQFQLEHPDPFFTTLAAATFMTPLHESTLEKFHATDSMNGQWLRPENFVGNGPFVIKEWHTNDYLEVEKNPYYWDAENVKLNKVRFYAINTAAEERAFRAGQLHTTNSLPIQQSILYQERKDPNLRSCELNGVYAYLFNVTKPPLNDVRVRKALAMAINREQITHEIIKDGRRPAYNLTPSIIPNYHPTYLIEENIAKAQELLAQAGYPNGKDFPEVEIVFNIESNHIDIAQAIQEMWKKNLNINIELANTEWKVLLSKKDRMDYQILRSGWVTYVMDPWDIMKNFSTESALSPTGWSNAEYDTLLNNALQAYDIPTRFKYLAQAEAILMDELPTMPIYFYACNYLIHPSVRGWDTNSGQVNYFQFIDLVPVNSKN